MQVIRKIILGLSVFMGVWVAGSFIGVMFNIGNPEFWTASLMWSLLASVLVMPGLVIAHHARIQAERKAARKEMQMVQESISTPDEHTAFVTEEHRGRTLWPEVEENSSAQHS